MEVKSTEKNAFLKRTEIVCLFSGQAGKIDRNTVRQQVAESIKVDPAKVYLLGLKTTSGSNDLEAQVVTYEDENESRLQLPNHLFDRLLSKEERKKKDAAPAAKPTPAAASTPAPADKKDAKADDKKDAKADDKKDAKADDKKEEESS